MGHVPQKPIADLRVMTFAEALAEKTTDQAHYDPERWIYVPDHYLEYRYILGTRGQNPLICVGVNPSTAEPGALDNTLKSVERIALGNGFDSFIMFNVYAQRATDPAHLDAERNPLLHQENLAAFRFALAKAQASTPAVWAAWGTIIEARTWLVTAVKDLAEIGEAYGARWYTAGRRSKKGHPHHPLYLRKDSVLEPFDCKAYVAGFELK